MYHLRKYTRNFSHEGTKFWRHLRIRSKSIKYYLKSTVNNLKLTYEEFLTVLFQIKGILNSQLLIPLSADIDDLIVLTPSHFLISRLITSLIEPDITNINENTLNL